MTPAELDSSALKSSVAFTGRLACMTRAEAFEVVRQHGGTPSQAVTKRTKLLIVGELGWPLLDDGRPSNKLTRASSYSVPVVSERRTTRPSIALDSASNDRRARGGLSLADR